MRRPSRAASLVASALLAASTVGAVPGDRHTGRETAGPETWTTLSPSPEARTEVAAAAVGTSIYVLGGFGPGGAPSSAVARYDTMTDRWSLVRSLPAMVNHAAAVSYGGDLYVVGGYSGASFSLGLGTGGAADAVAAFWRYDAEADTWSAMPPAPSERGGAAAAVIGDELLVAGGANVRRPLQTLEIFNFATGRWRRGPDLPLATEHTAGTAAGGAFYVLGGRPFYGGGTHRFAQRYDPSAQRWTRVADLTTGHAGFAAVTVCGRALALGGEDPGSSPSGTVGRVEIYDPDGDRWERLPDMRTPRHGFGGAAVDDRIFALEGGPVTLLSVTDVAQALAVDCALREGSVGGEERPGSRQEPGPSDDRAGGRDRHGPMPVTPRGSIRRRGERSSGKVSQPRADPASQDPMPNTGLDLAPLLALGAVLVSLGVAPLVATRRKARLSHRRSSR